MTLLDALSGGRHKLTNLKSGPAAKSGQVLQHNPPKATELLRRHEMTRWANNGLMHCSKTIAEVLVFYPH